MIAKVCTRKPTPSKDMTVAEAFEIARLIQHKHPNRLVCGSLGLMLTDQIFRDKINDLDFVIGYDDWDTAELVSSGATEYMGCCPGAYLHFYAHNPQRHCLFVLDDLVCGPEIEGLRIQHPKQMKEWKVKFGRSKDREDMLPGGAAVGVMLWAKRILGTNGVPVLSRDICMRCVNKHEESIRRVPDIRGIWDKKRPGERILECPLGKNKPVIRIIEEPHNRCPYRMEQLLCMQEGMDRVPK